MNSVQQGNIGEAKAALHFLNGGYEVYTAFGGGNSCDMVITKEDKVLRVSVKSTTSKRKDCNAWVVELRQRNHSRNKEFDSTKSDILAVYIVEEDRILLFNSSEVKSKARLNIKPL